MCSGLCIPLCQTAALTVLIRSCAAVCVIRSKTCIIGRRGDRRVHNRIRQAIWLKKQRKVGNQRAELEEEGGDLKSRAGGTEEPSWRKKVGNRRAELEEEGGDPKSRAGGTKEPSWRKNVGNRRPELEEEGGDPKRRAGGTEEPRWRKKVGTRRAELEEAELVEEIKKAKTLVTHMQNILIRFFGVGVSN